MRKVLNSQQKFGQVDISRIEFDINSRDEIPKLLIGLQHIYCDIEKREKVFRILKEITPEGIDPNNGRPGMELWKILVLGTIRLNCNWDYDKLQEIANNHVTLRQMLGHGIFDQDYRYALQTLKDNVSLLTCEVLDKINQVVVKVGQEEAGYSKKDDLKGRCDSFVVETDVHYPTDINLLFDAIRKVITLVSAVCSFLGLTTWRQSEFNIRKIKKLYRKAQKMKRSNSRDEKKKAEREKLIIDAHLKYLEVVECYLGRAKETMEKIRGKGLLVNGLPLLEINSYIKHAERQIEQVRRRVLHDEKIPHDEKVFSIFEEHTEWICKGKAGVPQELGLRVCVLEDSNGFILFHHVMQNQTDEAIAVFMVKEAQQRFPQLNSCSFDKGFYTPQNLVELGSFLDKVFLPKKGRLSNNDKAREHSEEFVQARYKHAAIESAINALENHSLDRCPDHGINGFKRYVALAVLARNIQILGHIIQQKELKLQKKLEKLKRKSKAEQLCCLAA